MIFATLPCIGLFDTINRYAALARRDVQVNKRGRSASVALTLILTTARSITSINKISGVEFTGATAAPPRCSNIRALINREYNHNQILLILFLMIYDVDCRLHIYSSLVNIYFHLFLHEQIKVHSASPAINHVGTPNMLGFRLTSLP
jgi:hypothetical protein